MTAVTRRGAVDYTAARIALGMSPRAADRLSCQVRVIARSLARGTVSARYAVTLVNRATRLAFGGAR